MYSEGYTVVYIYTLFITQRFPRFMKKGKLRTGNSRVFYVYFKHKVCV